MAASLEEKNHLDVSVWSFCTLFNFSQVFLYGLLGCPKEGWDGGVTECMALGPVEIFMFLLHPKDP